MYLTLEQAKQKILTEKYGGACSAAFEADLKRLRAHEPYQYILGYADFLDCRIDLSCHPMVPREETAHWVKRVIEEWRGAEAIAALDLFAGSGNVGIALLQHLPTAHVTLSEIDEKLLPGMARSLELNRIDTSRATFIAGDGLKAVTGRFDVITAVPPYLDPTLKDEMDPEMRYEPELAFFGSSDGYGHHRELIERGRDYLTPRGVLYLEHDMTQAATLKALVAKTNWEYAFWKDPYGHEGVLVLRAQHVDFYTRVLYH